MRVGQLARLEQVEVLELAQARPEVEEVEHRPHVGMRRGADHLQRRGQRGQVRRVAGELDHRGQVVLGCDVARLADAVRGRREVVGGNRPVGDRRRVDSLQTQVRELIAAAPPRFQRLGPRRTRQPEVLQHHGGGHRRQIEVFEQPPGSRQGVVLQEPLQQRRAELDVADAGPRPAFERATEAGATRRVLVHREQHPARSGGLRGGHARQGSGQGSQQHRSSRQHGRVLNLPSPGSSARAPAPAERGRPAPQRLSRVARRTNWDVRRAVGAHAFPVASARPLNQSRARESPVPPSTRFPGCFRKAVESAPSGSLAAPDHSGTKRITVLPRPWLCSNSSKAATKSSRA